MYRCTVYHGTAAICISIELYEIVQLRSGDGVALPLTLSLIDGVVGLMLRGRGPLIRSFFFKQKNRKKKIVKRTSLIRSNTVCIINLCCP